MSKNDILKEKWRPVALIILDGCGVAPKSDGNALGLAKMPFFNELIGKYPCLTLSAAGEAVGLTAGAAGNCETGHLTLGAGRPIFSGSNLINRAIADKSFFKLPLWTKLFKQLKKYDSALHLAGLLSSGHAEADFNHLLALLELAKRKKISRVYVHGFLDGQDAAPTNGLACAAKLEEVFKRWGFGQIASLSGRFYALNHDRHWDRTEAVYRLLVEGAGERSGEAAKAINKSYAAGINDNDFKPTVIVDKTNQPKGLIKDNDVVVFFNFKPEGAKQLIKALVEPAFEVFKKTRFNNLQVVTMTEVESGLPAPAVFVKNEVKDGLVEVVAKAGLKQVIIAESERYVPATVFFSGGRETTQNGEERILIPSMPDAAPAMSAATIAETAAAKISQNNYDLLVINLANADVVGRTGDIAATVKALETIDDCLRGLLKKIMEAGGLALITADHGKAETMMNWQLDAINKEDTANPVPLLIVGNKFEGYNLGMGDSVVNDLSLLPVAGSLADVAPTILKILGLEIPASMTGRSLL